MRARDPRTIAGLRVESRDQVDGYRFRLEGGWWLLIRFSGTEPVLRVYAETTSPERAQTMLQAGKAMAGL